MNEEIIIVSGLPRSGTSLMMQMIDAGGIAAVTDQIRSADTDNPRGYYELEQAKRIKEDRSWLAATRGKAFKMVSRLLYDLPADERYRIIFMQRDFDEMLASQEKMLARLGRPAAPRDQIKQSFALHLERLHAWLAEQKHMAVLCVSYNAIIERPQEGARRVAEFLGDKADAQRMAAAVDASLYRNRKPADTVHEAPTITDKD